MLDIEKYKPCIWTVLNRYGLKDQDFYDIALIGLWRACKDWDEEKAKHKKPQTWCMNYIAWQISREITKHNREMDSIVPISSETRTNIGRYWDIKNYILSFDNPKDIYKKINKYDSSEDFLSNINVESFLQKLTQDEQRILKLRMNGYTLKEISSEFGISKQAIEQRIKKIRERAIRHFGKDVCKEYIR